MADSNNSFDSRYFGSVKIDQLLQIVYPEVTQQVEEHLVLTRKMNQQSCEKPKVWADFWKKTNLLAFLQSPWPKNGGNIT